MINDRVLVRRLVAGEERALRAFVKEFEPRLMRFVVKKMREEDAQEVVQDTLVAALEALPLFGGRAALFSWLCGIARHEIADFYRKKRLKTLVFSRFEGLEQLVTETLGPEARLDRKELRGRIRAAMVRLSRIQRRLLKLKYVEGKSVREMAGELNISFKAAESGLFRARRAFALVFEEGQ